MSIPCVSCPFLEYHHALGQDLPFCRALHPGRELPTHTVQFTCTTGRYRLCKAYDEAIIDVTEQPQGALGK